MLLPIGDLSSANDGGLQHKSGGAVDGSQLKAGGAVHAIDQPAKNATSQFALLPSPQLSRLQPSVQNFVNGLTDSYPFVLNLKVPAGSRSMNVNSQDSIGWLQRHCSEKWMDGAPCHLLFAGKKLDLHYSSFACGHSWCPKDFACLPSMGLSDMSTVHVERHIVRLPSVTNGVSMDTGDDDDFDFGCDYCDSDASCAPVGKRHKASAD